jgi:NAD(P)-dependent dehydrogenase (short-subunit alcohol dehydrogenase family)
MLRRQAPGGPQAIQCFSVAFPAYLCKPIDTARRDAGDGAWPTPVDAAKSALRHRQENPMRAIVSGHSRGLGAAIAHQLLLRGIPVLALARNSNAVLAAAFPQLLREVALDLADSDALAGWLAGTALADFAAGADAVALVNNAGMLQPVGPLGTQDATAIARAVALNVAAPLLLANAVAAVASGECRILHVSSGAARSAYAGWSVYGATKAALDQHARAVAEEQIVGQRIVSLAPGVIDTEMQAEIRAVAAERFPLKSRFEALKRDGQLSSAENCAGRLVAFLLSDGFGGQAVADLRQL